MNLDVAISATNTYKGESPGGSEVKKHPRLKVAIFQMVSRRLYVLVFRHTGTHSSSQSCHLKAGSLAG